MENASLPSDVWNDVVTTASSTDDDLSRNLAVIRDVALKIIYIIIGTVGVLDNVCRRPWQLVRHHYFCAVHQNCRQGITISLLKFGAHFSITLQNLFNPSIPAVPNCYCSKGSAPYWSNPSFLIFDIRALWRSVLSARAPECQKLKMVN